MAIDYIPADKLFTVDFYGELCEAIWKTNLVFNKFFIIDYVAEGDFPNGEYEFVQVLSLSETGKTILIVGAIIIAIIMLGIFAILWNQRKLKKQLRQLQEMLEEKEDKPD